MPRYPCRTCPPSHGYATGDDGYVLAYRDTVQQILAAGTLALIGTLGCATVAFSPGFLRDGGVTDRRAS